MSFGRLVGEDRAAGTAAGTSAAAGFKHVPKLCEPQKPAHVGSGHRTHQRQWQVRLDCVQEVRVGQTLGAAQHDPVPPGLRDGGRRFGGGL